MPLFLGTDFLFFDFICVHLRPSVDYIRYPKLRSKDKLNAES